MFQYRGLGQPSNKMAHVANVELKNEKQQWAITGKYAIKFECYSIFSRPS
jgi:hypothetical protein